MDTDELRDRYLNSRYDNTAQKTVGAVVDGAVNAGLWYLIVMFVRFLYLALSGAASKPVREPQSTPTHAAPTVARPATHTAPPVARPATWAAPPVARPATRATPSVARPPTEAEEWAAFQREQFEAWKARRAEQTPPPLPESALITTNDGPLASDERAADEQARAIQRQIVAYRQSKNSVGEVIAGLFGMAFILVVVVILVVWAIRARG